MNIFQNPTDNIVYKTSAKGLLLGGVNFTHLNIVLKPAAGETPPVLFNYGNFIQVSIDFLIIAFVIFIAVKGFNAMRQKETAPPPAPPEPTNEEKLLGEIRDLLKQNR